MASGRDSRLIIGVGYLGTRVTKLWTAAGAKVFGTSRSRDRFDELRQLGVEPVLWDVNNGGDSLPSVDVALYCVGFIPSSGRSRREVYVEGLQNTLANLPRPGRLIYISSTGVFGDHYGDWVDETTKPNPMDEGGAACLAAEDALWDFTKREGWEAVVLRLAGIYGPERLINARRIQSGQAIAGDPDGYLNLIHVEDAALIVNAATTRALPGETYLVADGNPLTRREFYTRLAESLGAPPPTFDLASPARSRGNRRIANRKLLEEVASGFVFQDSIQAMRHPS